MDSVWVYASRRGGWILHATSVSDAGARATAWLEVTAGYEPIRGWQEVVSGPARCRAAFVVEGGRVDVYAEPTRSGQSFSMSYGTPSRFGVLLAPPSALGWLAAAAGYREGPLDVLSLGPCALDPSVGSGFQTVRFTEERIDTRSAAGMVFDAHRMVYRRHGGFRHIVWVEPSHGLLLSRMTVGARSGADLRRVWISGQ